MLIAVLASVVIGLLFARWIKGMNVGAVAFAMWVGALAAIVSAVIGHKLNNAVAITIVGEAASQVAFWLGRSIWE